MIVVKVELWSAITGKRTELARMMIANRDQSEDGKKADYECFVYRGRSADALQTSMTGHAQGYKNGITRKGKVLNHPRLAEHVWNLVAKALSGMGYGSKTQIGASEEGTEFFSEFRERATDQRATDDGEGQQS